MLRNIKDITLEEAYNSAETIKCINEEGEVVTIAESIPECRKQLLACYSQFMKPLEEFEASLPGHQLMAGKWSAVSRFEEITDSTGTWIRDNLTGAEYSKAIGAHLMR